MSNKAEVEVSYDVSNEFFRLWLDERMNYTCGVFDGTDNLEKAQVQKLAFLYDYAHCGPDTKSVLDIGCGWGANIEYLAVDRKIPDVHGITLSTAQHEEIRRRKIPGVTSHCVSYTDYQPPAGKKFDALFSICMMEHVATPEEARTGKHLDLYRNYFRLAREWTRPGAYFAVQTILRNVVPRNRKDLEDIGFCTYKIFPGGISLRMEDIVMSVTPYWEIKEVTTRRIDYMKTCEHWLARLQKNEKLIREKWGNQVYEDYDRYLSTCVRAFDKHYQSLAQWSLKRVD